MTKYINAIIAISFLLPANLTGISGNWTLTGGTFRNITTLQSGKSAIVNANNFIVYGLDQTAIAGLVTFEFDLDARHELTIEMTGTDADANPVKLNTYKRKQYTYAGITKFSEEK